MKSPVQWPKLPFWVGLRCLPWGIRKAIRTNCRHPGTMGWCQLNKIHWPQRRGRGTSAKSSPIGSDLPSPESVKEIGSRSCFWSWCHRQKETLFAHFFSFLVPTCHLKHPSNKLKEPCQVAHSIINQTCLSWASWQIKRTVSLLHRVLRPLSCAQQPPQGKDKEDKYRENHFWSFPLSLLNSGSQVWRKPPLEARGSNVGEGLSGFGLWVGPLGPRFSHLYNGVTAGLLYKHYLVWIS